MRRSLVDPCLLARQVGRDNIKNPCLLARQVGRDNIKKVYTCNMRDESIPQKRPDHLVPRSRHYVPLAGKWEHTAQDGRSGGGGQGRRALGGEVRSGRSCGGGRGGSRQAGRRMAGGAAHGGRATVVGRAAAAGGVRHERGATAAAGLVRRRRRAQLGEPNGGEKLADGWSERSEPVALLLAARR
jgi:hypothetical protein